MNILMQVFYGHTFLFLWEKYMGSGVGGFLTLLETAKLFSETVVPFYTTVRILVVSHPQFGIVSIVLFYPL